jgi:hypothetical protein
MPARSAGRSVGARACTQLAVTLLLALALRPAAAEPTELVLAFQATVDAGCACTLRVEAASCGGGGGGAAAAAPLRDRWNTATLVAATANATRLVASARCAAGCSTAQREVLLWRGAECAAADALLAPMTLALPTGGGAAAVVQLGGDGEALLTVASGGDAAAAAPSRLVRTAALGAWLVFCPAAALCYQRRAWARASRAWRAPNQRYSFH